MLNALTQDMLTLPNHQANTPAILRGTFLLIALLLVCTLVRQDMPGGAFAAHLSGGETTDPELLRAAQRGALCSDMNPTGVGLRGEYYAKEKLQGTPLLVRTDAGIDFDSALDWSVVSGISPRPKSVRWTGWVKPPVTGRYQFHLQASGATVTVARKVLTGLADPNEAYVELHAGRYAPVVIEMSPLPEGAEHIRFEWTTPYGARFVVPRALLFTPSESAATIKP